MIVLGIDPGLAIVGWGVLEYKNSHFKTLGYGAITTPKELNTQQRLKKIYDELADIIRKYRPEQVAIEELFFNTNTTTGIRVSEARGVILLICEQAHMDIFEYTPLQVKQAVVGYGRAEKKQVITMVTMLLSLPEPPKPDDTADALAIAICHGHSGVSRLASYYNK
ncbi:MAG: crossover junction endodeoxyribonuclease RuvC [Clostridia bacterium]|nr:crossover junction endodeoxyribonuclease RuvC [Clostridia bacterium]